MSRSDVQDFCVGKTGIWSVLNHSDPVTDVDDVSRHKRPFGATLPCRCNLVTLFFIMESVLQAKIVAYYGGQKEFPEIEILCLRSARS